MFHKVKWSRKCRPLVHTKYDKRERLIKVMAFLQHPGFCTFLHISCFCRLRKNEEKRVSEIRAWRLKRFLEKAGKNACLLIFSKKNVLIFSPLSERRRFERNPSGVKNEGWASACDMFRGVHETWHFATFANLRFCTFANLRFCVLRKHEIDFLIFAFLIFTKRENSKRENTKRRNAYE